MLQAFTQYHSCARSGSLRSRGWFVLLAAACVLAGAAAPAWGRIVGDILSVGYRAGGQDGLDAGSIVRAGAWVPVLVDLSLENQAAFDGVLRVRQRDSDGDFCVHEVPVHLRAESGAQKQYWLYPVAGPDPQQASFEVSLFDEEGEAVGIVSGGELTLRLEPQFPVQRVPDKSRVIVALTPDDRPAGRITCLVRPDQLDKHRSAIHLSHITPSRVPPRWIGLEMVDCLVWDEADATALTREQLVAIVQWVQHGGMLVLASARTSDTLTSSDLLAPLLPVECGRVVAVKDFPSLRERLLRGGEQPSARYPSAVPAVPCRLRDGIGASVILAEPALAEAAGSDAGDVLIATRRFGRGNVIFVGAALRDLLNTSGNYPMFFNAVLGLRGPLVSQEQIVEDQALFPNLQERVGLQEYGGIFMIVAFVFLAVYLFASTFGAWAFLKSRGWARHNWLAFAAVAAGASVVSVSGVQTVRGVGQTLYQLSIVDLAAGESAAEVTSYFGLKTGTHSRLDVWLPDNYPQDTEPGETQSFLRPLTEWHGDLTMERPGYTDPGEYALGPGSAELIDVPIRATLKRFEGHWRGRLRGTASASIHVLRDRTVGEQPLLDEDEEQTKLPRTDVISPDSTFTNNLGVDLERCYLIHASQNVYDYRVFNCYSPRGAKGYPLAFAHPIRGVIHDGETVKLADRIYFEQSGRPVPADEWSRTHGLDAVHTDWGRSFARSLTSFGGARRQQRREFQIHENYRNALLLLTTLNEYDPQTSVSGPYDGRVLFVSERCRQLDLSDLLTRDTAILVGFADAPGPVTLCTRSGSRDYRPVTPSRAWTLYRIVIPLKSG